MKTIPIRRISPTKGYHLDLSSEDEWVMEIFTNLFPEQDLDTQSIKGKLDFSITNQVVTILGEISYALTPLCGRCGEPVAINKKLHFSVIQAPLSDQNTKEKSDDDDEDGVELTSDDLNFSFYQNDEIRIDAALNDEIALDIPLNYYCKDQKSCELRRPSLGSKYKDDGIDPRWLPLKDLKKIKN